MAIVWMLGLFLLSTMLAGALAAQPSEGLERAGHSAPRQDSATSQDSADDLQRVLALGPEDILQVTPEMEAFLEQHIGAEQVRATRLRSLLDAIFNPDGLGVTYGNKRTKTASETFDEASGNCLSFTMMFVALARHLGLDAYFVEVAEVTSWSSTARVDINAWHMFAEVGLDNGYTPVDFLPGIDKRYRKKQRIRDKRVAAHYFNNLGVETLTAGDLDGARRLLERAIELDRRFLPALTNLGVVERRAGDLRAAESVLLEALEVDRSSLQAARNLASLYTISGQPDKAAPLLERVERYLDRNPYHHYRLSQKAAAAGEHEQAIEHLEMAIRRQGDVSRFHEALSESYYALGDYKRATRALRSAARYTENERRRAVLDYRLEIWLEETQ